LKEIVPALDCVGRRVLIVEDEALIAMQLEENLQNAGWRVVGPAPSVCWALQLIERELLDVAILDFWLGDDDSGPIADYLDRCGIPFLFLTGHTAEELPSKLRAKNLLLKPTRPEVLVRALEAILSVPTPYFDRC
jgi:DNA-binding response OmpR family regulator